ncbi:uncharacterized protein GGS22DRAFT_155744 [Annulohypoxylon maeteangense]|uniref:uncharacterized protein n=1 Tax=Annulohypoxylon maeteangense TaxID=1927788 RepID=UPI0020081417|nr:uncharacterized protein GGS22DRAFT_155744 [Annulohypoxylon maeteangense]KAI0888396.1 hypothetical protein GGS22DRAFT_155744 [Annulohypoxylon maeteangense]
MALIRLTSGLWAALFAVNVIAQDTVSFNMFPAVKSAGLATQLGWSEDCVKAMNATLKCDPDLYRMAGQIDKYFWSIDNITTLCTDDCVDDSSTWVENVGDACVGQTYNVASKLVPVDSVAVRYVEGITMACLKSDTLQLNYTGDPTANEDSLVGDDFNNPNSTTQTNSTTGEAIFDPNDAAPSSNGTDSPSGPDNISDPTVTQSETIWCYYESQNWLGADVDLDCDTDPSSVFCTDPDSMNRMANLYYDTTLCSPCFLTVLWHRINSLFLPDNDYSDYLIQEYQDIQDVCQIAMPESVVRALPGYAAAPNATFLPPGTDPANNSSAPSAGSGNCTTQLLSPGLSGCDTLSQKYGVTTGDLQTASNSDTCTISNSTCLPSACTLKQVSEGDTCDSLSKALSTSTLNVTITLFQSWNPNIIGLCDSLLTGQYICSSPPGGAFTLPAPINGTNTDASSQNRGGQGPVGVVPTTNSTAAAPTQAGIDKQCTKFAYASSGDTCYGFTQTFKISMANLTTWNPVLGYPDGANCSTQFWLGYDYCVGVPGGSGGGSSSSSTASASTSSKTPTTTTSLPFPTQSGIIATCNKFNDAEKGDYCSKFATDNDITTQQLYAWNPVLGANGENCNTQFQAGVDYCVGVSSTAAATMSK